MESQHTALRIKCPTCGQSIFLSVSSDRDQVRAEIKAAIEAVSRPSHSALYRR